MEPIKGFDNPKLAQIFTSRVTPNTPTPSIVAPTTTIPDTTTPATVLGHSELPVGAIAGGIVGGFVLVLLIAAFFVLRKRRQQMEVPPHAAPELASTSTHFNPQELQAREVNELSHGQREDIELASAPISGSPETGTVNSYSSGLSGEIGYGRIIGEIRS